jgi:hypothetical protein
VRDHYERALKRIKRDIDQMVTLEEPQHKALMDAFKAAQMCTEALAALPDEGPDPYAALPPEAQEQIEAILAKYNI